MSVLLCTRPGSPQTWWTPRHVPTGSSGSDRRDAGQAWRGDRLHGKVLRLRGIELPKQRNRCLRPQPGLPEIPRYPGILLVYKTNINSYTIIFFLQETFRRTSLRPHPLSPSIDPSHLETHQMLHTPPRTTQRRTRVIDITRSGRPKPRQTSTRTQNPSRCFSLVSRLGSSRWFGLRGPLKREVAGVPVLSRDLSRGTSRTKEFCPSLPDHVGLVDRGWCRGGTGRALGRKMSGGQFLDFSRTSTGRKVMNPSSTTKDVW